MTLCITCKGQKVIRTPVRNLIKVDMCPTCKGSGSMISEYDWRKKNSKNLNKG